MMPITLTMWANLPIESPPENISINLPIAFLFAHKSHAILIVHPFGVISLYALELPYHHHMHDLKYDDQTMVLAVNIS